MKFHKFTIFKEINVTIYLFGHAEFNGNKNMSNNDLVFVIFEVEVS